MPQQNLYTNIIQNVYTTGIFQGRILGYREGVEDTCSLLISENNKQGVSSKSYLSLAEKIQEGINKVMENYQSNNKDDVQLFLQGNSSILSLVNETYSKIHEFIPETRKVVLEVLTNPEDNQKSLIATIYPNLSFDEAMDRLDIFDREWFASKFIDSDMIFNVSLDFE